jgi:hypothetical protein
MIVVHTDQVHSELCQTGPGHKAHITRSNDADIHRKRYSFHSSEINKTASLRMTVEIT